MKPTILVAFLSLIGGTLCSEEFHLNDFGVSITAPDNWKHDSDDKFGFVIINEDFENNRVKIRIHKPTLGAMTPKEQAELTFDTINKKRQGKHPLESIRYSKDFITDSGLHGFVSSHGFGGPDAQPYIDHYYFKSPTHGMFCVCAYSGGSLEAARSMEDIIQTSLRIDEEK